VSGASGTAALLIFRSGSKFRADTWSIVGETLYATGHFVGQPDRKVTRSWPRVFVVSIRWAPRRLFDEAPA